MCCFSSDVTHCKLLCFTALISLGIYGFYYFPLGWVSTGDSSSIENAKVLVGNYGHIAVALFLIMQFCVSVGISSIPYFLLAEVFPFK